MKSTAALSAVAALVAAAAFLAAALALGLAGQASAQEDDEGIYGVDSWPGGLAGLPCSAFARNPDRSWSQVATIVVQPGNLRMRGHRFRNDATARMLERRCARR